MPHAFGLIISINSILSLGFLLLLLQFFKVYPLFDGLSQGIFYRHRHLHRCFLGVQELFPQFYHNEHLNE